MAQKKQVQVGVAVGVAAAAAAAAAGAYWLYGAEDAEKNRKTARSWMLKARGEVLEAVEKMQNVDKSTYMAVVNTVLDRYSGLAGVTSGELSQMTRDLKGAWDHIQKARGSGAKAAKTGKRAVKKATKKKKGKK